MYAVFAANDPVPVDGEDVPEEDIEIDGLETIVTEVTDFPPVAAVHGTDTVVVFVTDTVPIVGVCGTVVEVAFAAVDASPVPTVFIAETL